MGLFMCSCQHSRVLSLAAAFLLTTSPSAQAQHTTVPQVQALAAPRPAVPGAPRGVTAFVDVTVVPMDTDQVLPHRTVLIHGGRIAALGAASTLAVPNSAVRIDGQGKYLMPGLGFCHAHLGNFLFRPVPADYVRLARLELFRFLARGVTVARNMDYFDRGLNMMKDRYERPVAAADFPLTGSELKRLRGEAAAGALWSPRLYVAGQWAPKQYLGLQWNIWPDSARYWPTPRLDSVAVYVAAYKAAGYDFLKIHEERLEIADSVFAAARRGGLQVGGHVVDAAGDDTHSYSDQTHALAGRQRVADHGGGFPNSMFPIARRTAADTTAYLTAVAAAAGARRRAGMWTCGGGEFGRLKILTDSGAGLLYGDLVPNTFREMQHEGLTPYQALATATRQFGQYLLTFDPHGDETGTVAVGQRADLILLDDNPLADPEMLDVVFHSKRKLPAVIMIGGRWLPRVELERRLAALDQFDRLVEANEQVLAGIADTTAAPPLQRTLQKLEAVHQRQAYAMVERFVLAPTRPAGGADSLRMPERLTELFARQLGEMRAALPAAVQPAFDTKARAWLATRAAEGYHVIVVGVGP